jgi:hypothetical protein
VPSEYATSPIVAPVEIPTDDQFNDFELNPQLSSTVEEVVEGAMISNVTATVEIDPTLESISI